MRKAIAATMMLVAAGSVSVAALGGTASAGEDCLAETYTWNNTSITPLATWNPTIGTGISIPAPAGSEHLAVVGASWTAYDRLMDENPDVTRETPEENGERFTLRVGGVQVGGASADLPDTAAEGAPTPWFSGVISGQFGGVDMDVPGGAITLHHAGSGAGLDQFTPKTITLNIVRCTPVVVTTTVAPTSVAPTTTLVASAGPTTTVAGTTPTTPGTPTTTNAITPVLPTTPTTPTAPGTPTTIVGSGGPTPTVPGGSLPVTGGDMTLPLILAALAAGTGTVLLMVRRKADTN